jgi:hypothetical protein
VFGRNMFLVPCKDKVRIIPWKVCRHLGRIRITCHTTWIKRFRCKCCSKMRHHNSSNNLVETWVATWCFSSLDDFVWFASQRWSVAAHNSATGAVAGLQVTTTPLLGVSKKNPNGNDRHPFKRCCTWTSLQAQNSHTNLRPGGRYESYQGWGKVVYS